ncbi:MAG: exopolysaccharide biosynthesis polyprenyl glycosylphosphotransferase [Fusobacteriaceae bacterium]|nr:exopolysaccharide biosynthesis polyprenyl glycosylphosphotransferase [Fusobacteriaceae bacterium]
MYLNIKKADRYNFFLNILIWILGLLYFEDIIGVFKIFKVFIIIMVGYILNVYNLEKRKYTLRDFLSTTLILLPQLFLEYRIYFFDGGYKFILLIYIFQNVSKLFFLKLSNKQLNVAIIGEKSFRDKARKIIESRKEYIIYSELDIKDINENFGEVDVIIITNTINDLEKSKYILNQKLKGITIYDYYSFYEEFEEKIPINVIDENWILFGKGYAILHEELNVKVKRFLDIIYSLIIGGITLPIMLISAIIIKIESKGPVIYKQLRVGEGDKEFTIYKFRSMKSDAEKDGAKWAVIGDSRITRFGNFMRKTRIDELPQLWNVLKGEMSFVGPRPERMVFIKELEKQIPFYNIRHCIKPGLTGWAQVMYPYGASIEDAYKKLQYDLFYVKHQNLTFDLTILFRTIKIVIFRKGR